MAISSNASCPVSGPIYQEDLETDSLGSFSWSTYNGILHTSTTLDIDDANDWIPE
jgi:hypothetical protein